MQFTSLGTTGVTVSRICLGCMSYGASAWRPWVLDEDASRPFFQVAIEQGINFFDTADMYSLGASEEVTGRALRDMARRDEIVIATKVFWPMGEGPNLKGLSRKHIVQACEASLRRLGVDYIDLYQIHRFDPATPLDETLAALDHLVSHGKVLYVGASSGEAWRFADALAVAGNNGWAPFVTMQNHYNLLYREEEREMIPLCVEKGIGCLPWSPLARGMLAGARTSIADTTSTARAEADNFARTLYGGAADHAIVDAVKRIASARGVQPAEIALAWLLSKPVVTAPIVGATKIAHLEAAIRAVELVLTSEEISALEAPYQPLAVKGF